MHAFTQSLISSSKDQKQTKRLHSALQKNLSSDLNITKAIMLEKSHASSSSEKISLVGKYRKKIRLQQGRSIITEK